MFVSSAVDTCKFREEAKNKQEEDEEEKKVTVY